jgi:hypothetical protein
VRLVDDQQRPVLARERPQRRVVAVVGQHDAHVGHRGLGQHAGDLASAQGGVQSVQIVELDRDRRLRHIDRRPHVAGS